jgi:hypothetical protein
VRAQAREVAQRAGEQRVVPAGQVKGGYQKAVMTGFNVGGIPERVGVGVGEHLPVTGRKTIQIELVEGGERQVPQPG